MRVCFELCCMGEVVNTPEYVMTRFDKMKVHIFTKVPTIILAPVVGGEFGFGGFNLKLVSPIGCILGGIVFVG
jgi:hypothetical protein